MKFTVTISALVRELKLLAGVVARESTIPILGNVLIEAEAERIALTATDLDISLQTGCAARITKAGEATVPARRLLDYVRALPAGDLQITQEPNEWISLLSGRARARMAGMSRESFPILPSSPSEDGVRLPLADLISMIGMTAFAISKEESRFTMDGALLNISHLTRRMVATDGHRLAMASGKSADEMELSALIPSKALGELRKLAAESDAATEVVVLEDANNLFFEIGDRLLRTRKLTGNFPDYTRVLPKDQPHMLSASRVELLAAIGRVATFSDEASNRIVVTARAGELALRAAVAEIGESEEGVAAEYDGPNVEIGFNAKYLEDFLKVATTERVALLLKDSNSAGELRPVGGETAEGYRYVVMPMRV
jgi:DNA polymerase III subunit beta